MLISPGKARAPSDAGFTLVEMMIVVTIIGILAAVAIPRYIGYVRMSETSEVGQTSGLILMAVQSYIDSQSLSAATVQTTFDKTYLIATGDTAPTGQTSITGILPQLNLPATAKFTYQLSAKVATAGPASGLTTFCITATGRSTAGIPNGLVLYSAVPATSAATGWTGNMNNTPYANAATVLTGITAGGYCATSGLAQATQS